MSGSIFSFTKICLLSESALKIKAAQSIFKGFEIQSIKGGETNCPQPIGKVSALQCMMARAEPHRKQIAACEGDTLFLVIENYVKFCWEEKKYRDHVAILALCNGGHTARAVFDDNLDYCPVVPSVYESILQNADIDEPRGLSVTIGERIAETTDLSDAKKLIVSKDWFRHVNDKNVDRVTQIKHSLKILLVQLNMVELVRESFDVYQDFPRAGVQFEDMFPVLTSPQKTQTLYEQMMTTILLAHEFDTDRFFIAGLESRGLLLGATVAALLGVPFVPLRKKNKLPRDEKSPIVSSDFDTEYSNDTMEIQKEHLKYIGDRTCVILDDLIASGGSVEVVIKLLQQCNVVVSQIVVLKDVHSLRSEWRAKLATHGEIPVSFVM